MKVLLIKTSSLGDVVHALPAVTEALLHNPDIEFSWVVEQSFADIPRLHSGVTKVLPVSIRQWRMHWWQSRRDIFDFVSRLRETNFDLVIDSQGLMKSGIIAGLARGEAHGYSHASAREGLAGLFYKHGHTIEKQQHAVQRQKQLFATSFGYQSSETVDWGLPIEISGGNKIALIHGTTWISKEWPIEYWQELVRLVRVDGYEPVVPAGNDTECSRAELILGDGSGEVLSGLTLAQLAKALASCKGAVSVDTGLGHLAPALGLPVVGLFGATRPGLTGIIGLSSEMIVSDHLLCIPCLKRHCQYTNSRDSSNIHPPCFEQTTPERVWQALQRQIGSKDTSLV